MGRADRRKRALLTKDGLVFDATALAAAINDGRLTAVSAMQASLEARQAQAELGAVTYLDADQALADAKAADAMPADQRGPFHGVPFLVKDLGGAARGLPAAAGSAALRARSVKAPADSDLMAGFRAAGLIPFGLTATPPFGLSLSCEPEGLPPCRNPWNPALTPGGSSGGAAAAVAAGLVAIAHATDAAGSIRVPAACCGLTGLKPSRGACPGGPDYTNHLMGIAAELVLARSVRDVATAFDAVGGRADAPDPDRAPRIGVVTPDRCDKTQIDATREAAAALAEAGCAICAAPDLDDLGARAHDLARVVLAVSLAEWLEALSIPDHETPPLAAAMAGQGRAIGGVALFAAGREIQRLSHKANGLFGALDAIVTPVLAHAPPPVGAFDLAGDDAVAHMARLEAFAPNAALANVAGLPALALPFGQADGLPLGVQLIGPTGSDLNLLKIGADIEKRAPTLTFPFPIAGAFS